MPARSTTTAGKVKVNLALEPAAYESLRRMAGSDRGLGGLISDLIIAEERRRQEEAEVLARLRFGGRRYSSELQQSLARLEESEARYDRLATRMSAIIFELSSDGQLIFANQALTDLTGFTRDELTGQGWRALLFPAELQDILGHHLRQFRKGDVTAYELVLATKDGRRVACELSTANQYSRDGTLERVVGFALDFPRRRQAESRTGSRRNDRLVPGREASPHEPVAARLETPGHEWISGSAEWDQLRERQETSVNAMLRQMPDGMVVAAAPSGRVVLSASEGQQRDLLREYPWDCGFHADGRPYVPDEWPLARALHCGEVVVDEEIGLLTGNGARCIVSVSAVPVQDDVGGILAAIMTWASIPQYRSETQKTRPQALSS